VRKDVIAPQIIINTPTPNQQFGSTAPSFTLTIVEGNIDSRWYTIDGGVNNYTFAGTSGTINSGAWSAAANGSITIIFYVNDTLGNLNSSQVVTQKDALAPQISVNTPTPNQQFESTAPSFTLTIVEGNVDSRWYTIDGGVNNYTFAGTSGTINSGAWSAALNGSITIIFYVNDTLGNLNSSQVIVRKDVLAPQLTINTPTPNQQFGSIAPSFTLTIVEGNIDSRWYTIDGGVNNYTFAGTSGTINSGAWSAAANGSITIIFYVNDTLGNINSSQVIVRKDVLAPQLTINLPTPNQIFGLTAPNYDVTIIDGNIDESWYELNNGTDWSGNYTFSGSTGTIDQSAWDFFGNGTVTIRFYANDTLGNSTWKEVTVRRNIYFPSITINSPNPNQLFGIAAPTFNVYLQNADDTYWYTIDNGVTNYTFVSNTTINQIAWDGEGNGTVTIRFYANDSAGNIGWSEVTVRKDIENPLITINTPASNQLVGATAPDFDIIVTDSSSISTTWYTLDGGANNYTITGITGTIDQTAWDGEGNGTVTIRFYANDTLGNVGWSEVTVRKDIDNPLITINTPTANQLIGVTAPNFDITAVDSSGISTTWYTLDGGANNYTFLGATGTIDQTAWDGQGNGTVTIRFYTDDNAGNEGWSEVTVRKDIDTPTITINTPAINELFGSTTPGFDVTISDPSGISTTWYTLDGGANNYTFVGAAGTINQTAWDALTNGTGTIRFYANDTLGNLGYEEIMVQKDILAPVITINSPVPDQTYIHDIPTFSISIIEGNLNITWYTLDGGLTNITFTGLSGTINQLAWESAPNGTVTLRFYANDTFGNLGFNEVSVQFNKFTPKPFILSSTADTPDNDGQFDLDWTVSIGADNYSIYMYSSLITEINSSVTTVATGQIDLNYSMTLTSGTYYFLVRSYNETGFTDSNQLTITVEISPEGGFDLISFLTNPLTLINFGIMIGLLAGLIVKVRKKYYKSGDKEIQRIEEIRRKEE
jgi:hypothetical protein